jgi:predicted nucleic acid-binding protein
MALARLRQPVVAQAVAAMLTQGAVAVCSPVMFELGFSARTSDDLDQLLESLATLHYIDTVEADHRRSIEVQGALAATGRHRGLSLVDALVAAAAERTGLVVLHYDHDFERIADVTGQPHAWIVPPGSVD